MHEDFAAGHHPEGLPLVLRGRVVLPDRVLDDGVVAVQGGHILWVGPSDASPEGLPGPSTPAGAVTILPGLIDVHCHGGGGASFPDVTTAQEALAAVHEHRRHGTTTLVASLVTAAADVLLTRTALLADLADAGEIGGIHLEGPFLSRLRCGAQDPDHMVPGSTALVQQVVQAARGHLVAMTVAAEVPGVLGDDGVLAHLASGGAVPSFGHTDASAEVTEEGLRTARTALAERGGRSGRPTVTHLFNGMPPLHHRDPGPVAACLGAAARGEAVVELVADGVHLAPATVRAVFDLVGAENIALVTDAMAAAGMPDGTYVLGPVAVRVKDGVARLADGGAIAGGTAHLLDVVRQAVRAGVPLVAAVRSASGTPAAVVGRTDIGALAEGGRADLLIVDEDLRPLRVLHGGSWVTSAGIVTEPAS